MSIPDNTHIRWFRRRIFGWFFRNRRDLPWRSVPAASRGDAPVEPTCGERGEPTYGEHVEPWHVFASEVMLQQTQVGRVIPKYAEFVARWPRPADLAAESPSAIIAFWSGLGYNRRALNLWRAARVIADAHQGRLPRSREALLALPGVGPYTAAAVAAFAWNDDAVAADTNIRRVFQRVFFGGEFAPAPSVEALDAMFERALPRGRAREWNGALMDFGALVCVARTPACGACPLAARCRARRRASLGAAPVRRLARPQSRFDGSTRQLRGKILRVLTMHGIPISRRRLAASLGSPDAARCIDALLAEGLIEGRSGTLRLPSSSRISR